MTKRYLDLRQPLEVHERYLQNCEIAEFAEVENGIGHETHRGWQGHFRCCLLLKG